MYRIFLIHSSVGHLGYFHALAIVNSVAMNIVVHISFFLSFCYFFGAAPTAYGGSQARGRIGAVAPGLHHSSRQRRILNPTEQDQGSNPQPLGS